MPFYRRLLRRIARGGRLETRSRRYLAIAVLSLAVIWVGAIAYYVAAPRSYTSRFVFILPGTGSGSSINLDSLGTATTTSSSPFSSPDMSPTENYRKMLLSDKVQDLAAAAAGELPDHFPPAKIELSEQTKLITVKSTAPTGPQALVRAEALRSSFLGMLNMLRADEINAREISSRSLVEGYKARLDEVRQKMIAQQARTGLVSAEQYGAIVGQLTHLDEQLRDVQARLAQARAGSAKLAALLGITAEQATAAMVLRADPLFQALLDQSAKQDTEMAALSGTRGQNNPRVVDLQAERAGVVSRLITRGEELSGLKRGDVMKLRDLSVRDERARLFERLVSSVTDSEALAALQVQLDVQIVAEHARVVSLAPDVSLLDDLKRDVQVAETVFSSALARIDTSKADFFASYPMVQTFERPTLPLSPSSPQKAIAFGGAVAGSLFLLMAMVLTWLRTALLQKMLKKNSSSAPLPEPGFGMLSAHYT